MDVLSLIVGIVIGAGLVYLTIRKVKAQAG